MKNLNILLIISFFILLTISTILYISLTVEIGDIPKNKYFDNSNFRTRGHVYQYYQSGAKYEGEREALRESLLVKNINFKSLQNGWITIRFIVNYEGDTDRFRFFCIDKNYNEAILNKSDEENILRQIRLLKNWKIGRIDNKVVDSYSQITFKIEDGKITDIF